MLSQNGFSSRLTIIRDEKQDVKNEYNNPNLTTGLVGKVRKKNYLPKEEGREGGEKKRA